MKANQMKKYINLIAIAIISILSYSCEETVNGVELPYQELLVIRGELRANEQFNIAINKTLPPLEEYSRENSIISGVKAYIECDGKQYTLTNKNQDEYTNAELIPTPGKTYKLYAEWKNHKAYATTTIPTNNDTVYNIKIQSKYTENEWGDQMWKYIVSADAILSGNSVVLIKAINNSQYHYDDSEFAAKIDKDFTGNITIGTYPYWYYGEFGLSSIILTKYDLPYFDYYVTRREGDMNDDVFAISGNNIAWNIKGDGIGLFIGSNKKEIILK